MISYSGGPTTDSKLEEIILYSPKNDSFNVSGDKILKINYDDLFWQENAIAKDRNNPLLSPGDILILKGEPRYFARDNVSFILSISSVLISLGILVVSAISINK